jgi:outer membrane protein OmpA-like peptidoglycan-associated protein
MRRAVAAVAALAALAAPAATPALAQDERPSVIDLLADGAERPTGVQIAESVRRLELEVRTLEPEVRELRTEEREQDSVVVTISADVLFAFGSAALTPRALQVVGELAGRLAAVPGGEVLVVGHTDGIGQDQDNQVLSEQRAAAVADVLRGRLQPAVSLAVQGRGAREPVAPESVGGEDDPQGRALNRRVTVSFAEPA